MKKSLNLLTAARVLLFIDVVLCAVAGLAVLMVNGTESFSVDHLCLIVIVGITALTAVLLKTPGLLQNKAVLWLSALPLAIVSYQTVAASLLTYGA